MILPFLVVCFCALLFGEDIKIKPKTCEAEARIEKQGLVDIRQLEPNILVDLKYSGKDNFIGYDVYGCLSKAYLQKPAAERLAFAAKILAKQNPGFRLLVYDAARPKWAQKLLWDSLKKPESAKHIYVANPKRGSIHNYGCAVDLTIVDASGKPLDMGTPFDFFGNLAQPRLEKQNLMKGLLSKKQLQNRALLRNIMLKAGYGTTSSEWWHFNFGSLSLSKSKYQIIM